ncbi:MAG: VCBS repeat-containing protein [Cytophagales bacterium]
MKSIFFCFIVIICISSCTNNDNNLFQELSSFQTGIDFRNDLLYDENFNIFNYRNYYNGGGVGLGDINNDGLIDIFFNSNLEENRLYLNKGNFEFEDITEIAGIAGTKSWSTGVSLADINADGFLDIYVSNSGDIKGDNKQNELFINNGDLTFTEMASEYGLDDTGYSTHAAFFDYDRDGDLDCYLLNNSYKGGFRITNVGRNQRPIRDSVGGDKLFRNDDGFFKDVSEEAGIYGSVIGFGLGVTVGDVNNDGWMDIYVSNDFFERDYLYINNQDGTYNEELEDQIKSISAASMGADMADINNDGYAEIFVTDMLPEPDERIKTVTTFDNWDRHQYIKSSGYWNQFTRNTLQLNNGDDTFSEIGRLTGVQATDWSWGALMFDFQNDGNKDIFVANGIYQDLTDQDFLQYVTQDEVIREIASPGSVNYKKLIELIPSVPVSNYAFINNGDLKFENKTNFLGLYKPSFSNGSAYGDLDNDGDYDLVVNNVNMKAFIYKNNTEKLYPENRFLKIKLIGKDQNLNAIGSKVYAYSDKNLYTLEQMPIRGFQSTVDNNLIIGVGNNEVLDSVLVKWYDGSISKIRNIKSSQTITLDINDSEKSENRSALKGKSYFKESTNELISYIHRENEYVDFDKDRLLFHMSSSEGSCLCTGDLNNDSYEDIYIGGSSGYPGEIFLYYEGRFIKKSIEILNLDKDSEDTDCLIFDADGDGSNDLYVASGGNEFSVYSPELRDRLYFNNKLEFTKSNQILPGGSFSSSSVVIKNDFDSDGDYDLFVGSRLVPQKYGIPASSYILRNEGDGSFVNMSDSIAPGLKDLGMVTDAKWLDYDRDNDLDLVIVGHWMPVTIFKNDNNIFTKTIQKNLLNSNGWWNTIHVSDLNNDGFEDLIVGNQGKNSRFRSSVNKPLRMYVNDFDENGSNEQIIFQYNGDSAYTMSLRHDLVMQMPSLKKRYLKYNSYKNQTANDIFSSEKLNTSHLNLIFDLETSIFINKSGIFNKISIPIDAQFSSVHSIYTDDINSDGYLDIILGGNLHSVKPEVGRYDANFGQVYISKNGEYFSKLRNIESGIRFIGEVRDIVRLKVNNIDELIVLNNNDSLQSFSFIR